MYCSIINYAKHDNEMIVSYKLYNFLCFRSCNSKIFLLQLEDLEVPQYSLLH